MSLQPVRSKWHEIELSESGNIVQDSESSDSCHESLFAVEAAGERARKVRNRAKTRLSRVRRLGKFNFVPGTSIGLWALNESSASNRKR